MVLGLPDRVDKGRIRAAERAFVDSLNGPTGLQERCLVFGGDKLDVV